MKPKQKAKELSDKFKEITHDNKEITLMSLRLRKKCALICIDEILKTKPNNLVKLTKNKGSITSEFKWNLKYWQEVKQETNK